MNKLCLLFVFVPWLASPPPLYSQSEPNRENFSKAYTLFSQGNLSQAEELFLKVLDRDYPLNDYSLYFLGKISSARSAWDSARNYFRQLGERFPQSLWSSHARLELAKVNLAEKNYSQALSELRALQGKGVPNTISNEAGYITGQIHELQGNVEQAYSVYQDLRRSAADPWAVKGRAEVQRLREQQPQLFALTSPEQLSSEGDLLFRERRFREAEGIYRKLLQLNPEGYSRPQLLMNLANVHHAAWKRDEELSVLAEIVREYPESPEAPRALYRLARAHWNRDEDLKALDYLKQLKERYPKDPVMDYADFISARVYESLGRPDDAKSLYETFAKRFPTSRLRPEAEWRLAWLYYLQAEDRQARAVFKRLADDRAGYHRGAARYWQGRTAERMGDVEDAKRIYRDIVDGEEDSYYRGPAAKRLEKMGAAVPEKKITRTSLSWEANPPLDAPTSFHLTRARELADMELHRLAVAELDEIKNQNRGQLSLQALLMREYARNRAYDRSVTLANELGPAHDEGSRYRYPLAYWEMIQKSAERQDVDPYLIVALIRQESLFDPLALSPASAHGLMQILPSTAARIAKQSGMPAPQPERLFDPELNLALGIRYLQELLKLYSNSVVKALAAYNAGENAVARWEKQIRAEDEEEFIERIPYGETRLYVKLVLRNHLNYKKLYAAER